MLNRRGFLGLLAGAAVAPLMPVPAPPSPAPITLTSEETIEFGWEEFEWEPIAVGNTLTVRLPQRFIVRRGLEYTPQELL